MSFSIGVGIGFVIVCWHSCCRRAQPKLGVWQRRATAAASVPPTNVCLHFGALNVGVASLAVAATS